MENMVRNKFNYQISNINIKQSYFNILTQKNKIVTQLSKD